MHNLHLPIQPLFLVVVAALVGCNPRPRVPLEQEVARIFEEAHRSGEFAGTALVTRGNQTVYEGSFGPADRQRNLLNTNQTRYLAFSVLKPMTAVLVFQQIDAGRIRLTDTLESFFPNLAGQPAGPLTLQQLLTHTSGIVEVIRRHPDRRITPRDLEGPVVQSDTSFQYSNTAYVCLGLVLEAVTDRSYETLLREKIFQPAGMNDSGLLRSGSSVSNLSRGYRLSSGKPEVVELGVAMEALDGAGSLYTTARDLWRFDRALASGSILRPETQALMVSQQVKGRYGYGWFLSEQGGNYYPWHKGDYRGHTALLIRPTHRDEVVVLLSNQEETDLPALRTKVLRVLKARPEPLNPAPE